MEAIKFRDGFFYWSEDGKEKHESWSKILNYPASWDEWDAVREAGQEMLDRFSKGDTCLYEDELYLVFNAPGPVSSMLGINLKTGESQFIPDWENCKKTDSKIIDDWFAFVRLIHAALRGEDKTKLLAIIGPDFNMWAQESLRILEENMLRATMFTNIHDEIQIKQPSKWPPHVIMDERQPGRAVIDGESEYIDTGEQL